MITALATTQNDRQAWHGTRLGKFTASTIAKLMAEAKSITDEEVDQYAHLVEEPRFRELKSGPNKGQMAEVPGFAAKVKAAMSANGIVKFGDTALTLIKTKAIERVTMVPEHNSPTHSMRRGLLLEPAAIHLLNQVWTPIGEVGYQPYGSNSGATPDGLLHDGTATMDLKSPEDGGDVLRFAEEVPDGDFEALERWDANYAWQIMHQAKCSGVKVAYLVYFTDRLPVFKLGQDDVVIMQTIINAMADKYNQENEYPWGYTWASDGYFYAARRFELTEERSQKIDRHLKAAEVECVKMVGRYAPLLNQVPTVEEVEATVADLIEGSDVETEEAHDIRVLEYMLHHLKETPYPSELKTALAGHTLTLVRKHVQDAVAMLTGTINKDLK